MKQKIIIQDIDLPKADKIKDDVKWICESLGFMSGRDTEYTSFKIMFKLLQEFRNDEIIATETIARSLRLEPPTVNHHLRNLLETGVIVREKRKVVLRGGSLSSAIEEMRRDSDRLFERVLEIAKKIDEEMGF